MAEQAKVTSYPEGQTAQGAPSTQPEPAPAEPAPQAETESVNDGVEVDWASLADDSDVEQETEELETAPSDGDGDEAGTSEPAPTESAAPPEPTPAPAPAADTAPEPSPAPAPAPEPQQDTREQAPDPESLWQERERALAAAYTMDEDAGRQFLDSPEEMLPAMLARAQITTERFMLDYIQRTAPFLVDQVLQQRETNLAKEDAFFTAWPKLKERADTDPGFRQQIDSMRNLYRAMPENAKVPEEQLIQNVGAAVHVAFNIPVEDAGGEEEPAPAAPAPPARPANPRGASAAPPKLGQIEQFHLDLEDEDSVMPVQY